jgi:hypothetical protein
MNNYHDYVCDKKKPHEIQERVNHFSNPFTFKTSAYDQSVFFVGQLLVNNP